jgi:hypothetical protein
MGFAKIRGPLTSRIGRPVRYGAPSDVHQRGGKPTTGVIIDEVWANPSINSQPLQALADPHHWGDYSFASQLIKWDDGTYAIRLVYFRRRAGEDHWEYASQTTVSSDTATIKLLLERTLARRGWFNDPPKII